MLTDAHERRSAHRSGLNFVAPCVTLCTKPLRVKPSEHPDMRDVHTGNTTGCQNTTKQGASHQERVNALINMQQELHRNVSTQRKGTQHPNTVSACKRSKTGAAATGDNQPPTCQMLETANGACGRPTKHTTHRHANPKLNPKTGNRMALCELTRAPCFTDRARITPCRHYLESC